MKEIDKLAWITIKDQKVLGARSHNKTTFYIPGGKREPGENDYAALTREIKEELSVDLIPETIKYAGTFTAPAHDKPEDTAVKMTCFYAEFTGTIQPDAEIEEIRWLSHEDRQVCSPVTQLIMDWLKEEGLIE